MIYRVKYLSEGKTVFLGRGKLSQQGTVYYHPSAVRVAVKGFERRFPIHAGKGVIIKIEQGRVVGEENAIF